MTVEDSIINKLSKRYNKPCNVIKAVIESQFEFTRKEIKKVDIPNINEKEDLENHKTTFRFMGLGSIHINIKKLKAIKKNIRKKNDISL